MATINFLYRSTKSEAPLNIRLLFRYNNKDFVLGARTDCVVTKEYWTKHHGKKFKDDEIIQIQFEIGDKLRSINKHILNAFKNADVERIDKDWLKKQVHLYYNPPIKSAEVPRDLVRCMEHYLEVKDNDISLNTKKKVRVIKNLVARYESSSNTTILISQVNEAFKNSFEKYCIKENYAQNTIVVAFKFIKTVCNYAGTKGVETSPELPLVKSKRVEVDNIFLTIDDLKLIEKKSDLPEYLENAKDWLVISCYLGQRISDFMRFHKSMIRYENNKYGDPRPLIEFTQQKTGKIMTVAVHGKVIEILDKRNGNFPRPISDQKYNTFIKDACKLSGLTKQVKGSKKIELEEGGKIYRKVTGTFQKWELVTSHIGRRSFATNFYGKIPTSLLINVTGHSSETQFLEYIGKSNKDLAMELTNYF